VFVPLVQPHPHAVQSSAANSDRPAILDDLAHDPTEAVPNSDAVADTKLPWGLCWNLQMVRTFRVQVATESLYRHSSEPEA
jgi:hypothetical protein